VKTLAETKPHGHRNLGSPWRNRTVPLVLAYIVSRLNDAAVLGPEC